MLLAQARQVPVAWCRRVLVFVHVRSPLVLREAMLGTCFRVVGLVLAVEAPRSRCEDSVNLSDAPDHAVAA